jgi:hypothetical protein
MNRKYCIVLSVQFISYSRYVLKRFNERIRRVISDKDACADCLYVLSKKYPRMLWNSYYPPQKTKIPKLRIT